MLKECARAHTHTLVSGWSSIIGFAFCEHELEAVFEFASREVVVDRGNGGMSMANIGARARAHTANGVHLSETTCFHVYWFCWVSNWCGTIHEFNKLFILRAIIENASIIEHILDGTLGVDIVFCGFQPAFCPCNWSYSTCYWLFPVSHCLPMVVGGLKHVPALFGVPLFRPLFIHAQTTWYTFFGHYEIAAKPLEPLRLISV